MGGNDKKNQQQPATTQYGGANPGVSGNDPRGRVQNQIGYQSQRYENQQGPMAAAMAENYGRGTEADYGNYTDIMNQYRSIASGGGSTGGGGGGGGGPVSNYTAFRVNPGSVTAGTASYKDPFKSYEGFTEFSNTGGYSAQDIANMRARGVAPIRAAYGQAERNVAQQRALQGGYSPNAVAAQVKMAREQGQGMADASTNLEAQLAQMKQQGRLAGLQGMSGIEGQRLGADVDLSKFNVGTALDADKFNVGLDFQGQTYNADAEARAQAQNNAAAEAAASRAAQAAAASNRDRLAALNGMINLYGTTPGMSNMFGNQLLSAVAQGGNFGSNMVNSEISGQQLPGQWDTTMGRMRDVGGMAYDFGRPIYEAVQDNRNRRPNTSGANPGNLPIGGGYNPGQSGGVVPGWGSANSGVTGQRGDPYGAGGAWDYTQNYDWGSPDDEGYGGW